MALDRGRQIVDVDTLISCVERYHNSIRPRESKLYRQIASEVNPALITKLLLRKSRLMTVPADKTGKLRTFCEEVGREHELFNPEWSHSISEELSAVRRTWKFHTEDHLVALNMPQIASHVKISLRTKLFGNR
jgi:hypothetical protein